MFRLKLAAKNRIYVSQKSHLTKIWKTTFPKEFSNKICLKVEKHEYIYIFEMQFEKKNILFKNGGQNKCCDIVQ